MRYWVALFLAAGPLIGGTPASPVPIGVLRGDLLSWQGTAGSGEITFRTADNLVYRCTYNDKTYFERERLRIAATSLRIGDALDIVSDHGDGTRCYVRTVHIIPNQPVARMSPERLSQLRARRLVIDSIIPRGNMTFTGIVARISPDRLVLRTRSDGQKTFLLRDDTGYSSSGALVDSSQLNTNTRVFIRAGRNFEGDLEAYHVIWGQILSPR